MRKLLPFILFGPLSTLLLVASATWARSISYPVAELGNCASKSVCKTYCDEVAHRAACIGFAQRNQLTYKRRVVRRITPTPVPESQRSSVPGLVLTPLVSLIPTPLRSPTPSATESFAGQAPTPASASEEEKLLRELGITFPIAELGGCDSPRACEAYCNQPAHRSACYDFAKRTGLIEHLDKEERAGPGGCTNEQECVEYCMQPENREECQKFGPPPEGMEVPSGPGRCRSEKECDAYCKQHGQECCEWGKQHGYYDGECREGPHGQGPMEGPGGCKSERECKAYCSDHGYECCVWGKENGFHNDECYEGGPQVGPGGCSTPQECDIYCREHPDECQGPGLDSDGPRTGPGGCTSEEECSAYCQEHPDECGIEIHEDKSGPGGCQTTEECEAYCREHLDECRRFDSR